MNKIFAVAIGILLAGSAALWGQEKAREGPRAQVQKKDFRFIDENGDGIADVLMDHDGDGVPNKQDPDWIKAKGGPGLQAGQANRASFGKGSFRGGQVGPPGLGAGPGLFDGAGPKGRMVRRGR
ncbi:MAG: hypothetical protein FJY79_10115 [Candidatus Aminicenantes bacterium]|nr:hypothetical protein [Candidatus Aminicenantes bacterium]